MKMTETEIANTSPSSPRSGSAALAFHGSAIAAARIAAVIVFGMLLLYHTDPVYGQISADIPLENPIYHRVDRLARKGWIVSDLHGFRPMTEAQLLLLYREALRRAGDKASSSPDLKAMLGFLTERGMSPDDVKSSYGEAEMHGGMWATNSESVGVPEIDARVNPLLEQRGGRWQEGGVTGWVEPRLALRWSGWGAIDVAPIVPLAWSNEGDGGEFRPDLRTGVLKLGHGGFEAEMGKFEIRWGHAQSGSLLFGGTQKPFLGAQLRNAIPVTLPSIFKGLGPLQFSAFAAVLDKNQHFPHPYLVGTHLGFRPASWLEFGFASSVLIGGDGSPDLSFWEAILEVMGRRKFDPTVQNYSNRNFNFDLRLAHKAYEAYTEFFVEDCCGDRWRNFMNLIGVGFPIPFDGDRLRFALEWVRTTEITYRHGTFLSGFENDGHLMGHPIGPDAMGFYLFSHFDARDDLLVSTEIAFEQRGSDGEDQRSQPLENGVLPSYQLPENRLRFALKPTWFPGDARKPWLRATLGYERVTNFEFRDGENRNNFLGMIEAGFHFN